MKEEDIVKCTKGFQRATSLENRVQQTKRELKDIESSRQKKMRLFINSLFL